MIAGTTGPAGSLPSASRCSIVARRAASAAWFCVAAANSAMWTSAKDRLDFGNIFCAAASASCHSVFGTVWPYADRRQSSEAASVMTLSGGACVTAG